MTVKNKYNKIILALPFILFVLTGISFAGDKPDVDTLAVVSKKIISTLDFIQAYKEKKLRLGLTDNGDVRIKYLQNRKDLKMPQLRSM